MANDIYTTTLGGLTKMVSPRVAEGVLNRALTAVARMPDDVDARTMSRLLRGRIRRDLERSLPRAGLRRSLAELDAAILAHAEPGRGEAANGESRQASREAAREPAGAPGGARPPRAPVTWRREPSDRSELPVRKRAFPIAEDVPAYRPTTAPDPREDRPEPAGERIAVPAPAAVPVPPVASARSAGAVSPATAPVAAPSVPAEGAASGSPRPAAAPAPRRTGAPPVPARAVARVAEQEGVRQWVWSAGTSGAEGRGDGPEAVRVAADVRAIRKVLARHGELRSLHVRHGTGQVLVGTAPDGALLVAGDEGINVGAIYAAFRALEEAS